MYVDTQETAFLHDLSKPSLEALAHVLRHREMWPAKFKWRYNNCDSCAMGLAKQLWQMYSHFNYTPGIVAQTAITFGMPMDDAMAIFVNYEPQDRRKAVTPEMVADQIDQYLASRVG